MKTHSTRFFRNGKVFLKKYFFMYLSVLPAVCMYTALNAWCPRRTEEVVRSLEQGYELPHGR